MKVYVAIFLLSIFQLGRTINIQKQLEYQLTLDYLIGIVKQKRLNEFDYSNLRKCSEQTCCICNRQFKNSTFSSLHIALYHHKFFNHTENINILFDESVSTQLKYYFCNQYLQDIELSTYDREDICIIISEAIYRPKIFKTILQYILYFAIVLISLIYYSTRGLKDK